MFELIKELLSLRKSIGEKKDEINILDSKLNSKTSEISNRQAELDRIEDTISSRDMIIQEIEKEKQSTIEKYQLLQNQELEKLNDIQLKVQKAEGQLETQKDKVKMAKHLFNIVTDTIERYSNSRLLHDLNLTQDEFDTINELVPAVEIKLHSEDIPGLKKLRRENKKMIEQVFKRYEKRYTTKANRAVYQLMVLALSAELQNILISLKYNQLEKCMESLKVMIAKYLKIAADGNQQIAPTINSFIAEIEELYTEAIKIEYEYFVQKEREKAEQQAIREQMRQEAAERKALEEERKKVEDEEKKYIQEINNIKEQIEACEDSEKLEQLNERMTEIQNQLELVEDKKEDIISRQNGKAGNVYIISNLGSFGEDVFKVGMTRRLEPMDRVKELGDASVPFNFDVHSFIFSDDAVSLEKELHNRLEQNRVNKVNTRKEFFRVSLDEIENLVHEINPSAEFNQTMIASEYRQSLSL